MKGQNLVKFSRIRKLFTDLIPVCFYIQMTFFKALQTLFFFYFEKEFICFDAAFLITTV